MARYEHARILLVDDSPDLVFLMEKILAEEGYSEVVSTTDPRQAADLFMALSPDIVLLDLHMPGMNGFDVMAQIKAEGAHESIPIVMLTGDASPEARLRALRGGAVDFLTKPFDKTEVHLRMTNLLHMRFMHRQLSRQNELLEIQVQARTRDLEKAKLEILDRLAMASEFRDDQTGSHTQRVGRMSSLMAEAMGLNHDDVSVIRDAAPLHDVGKIAIPDVVLLKPGLLSRSEWEVMKTHTIVGARMLSNSLSPVLQMGEVIALNHHEHWDGSGYRKLMGEDIPLVGRIVSVADAFDAMTHTRPYHHAVSADEATEEILRCKGKQFCPLAVDAFLTVRDYAERIELRLSTRSGPIAVSTNGSDHSGVTLPTQVAAEPS